MGRIQVKTEKPLVLIQWDLKPGDEIEEIQQLLRDKVDSQVLIEAKTWKIKHGLRFTRLLHAFLKNNSRAQVVYLSAHGHSNGLAPAKNTNGLIPYKDVFEALNSLRGPTELVLGSCGAMAADRSQLLKRLRHLPKAVRWVWGFSGKPGAHSVCNLLVDRISEALEFFANASACSAQWCSRINTGQSAIGNGQAENALEPAVDKSEQRNLVTSCQALSSDAKAGLILGARWSPSTDDWEILDPNASSGEMAQTTDHKD